MEEDPMKTILSLTLVLLMLTPSILTPAPINATPTGKPTPPDQPTDGPGGTNYTHASYTKNYYGVGSWSYWLYEPAAPTPTKAPVIVFNHGYAAITPYYYEAWVIHLVKRGNIVIYPRYQLGLITGAIQATLHATVAVRHALKLLNTTGHVTPDLTRFAITGHSLGGGITAAMATQASTTGLPVPRAIMPVQPYIINQTMVHDFHSIPSSTLMLVIVGQNDTIAGTRSATQIFTTADQIPPDNKDYVIQRTDRHGFPGLIADHTAPVCPKDSFWTNAMDYYSTWKLFDALTDYAFYGTEHDYCLGNTTQQRYMGLWSDGTPVQQLLVTDTP
jgi:dienelactone hydrolase